MLVNFENLSGISRIEIYSYIKTISALNLYIVKIGFLFQNKDERCSEAILQLYCSGKPSWYDWVATAGQDSLVGI